MTTKPCWKCHTPNLLSEILKNNGSETLRQPIRIFADLLHQVATRAAELNDPALNLLMLRLTLYDAADLEKHSAGDVAAAYAGQHARMAGGMAEGIGPHPYPWESKPTNKELVEKLRDFATHGVDWVQGRPMSDLLALVREASDRLENRYEK